MNYSTLKGVEIFATGKHNGDEYTDRDLDDMIRAFNELDFKPPLKLGHDNSPGVPAVGYIGRLWREGNKLLADFVDINEKVFNAIREKAFNRVSAEIYWNLERAGKKYRRALKALALLGAQIPAVAGLKPLEELFTGNSGEVHLSTESESAAASAAQKAHDSQSNEGESSMDLKELEAKLAALEAQQAEEKKLREAAEAKLAEVLKQQKPNPSDEASELLKAIKNLTSDQKAQKIAELAQKVKDAEQAAAREAEARKAVEKKLSDEGDRIKKLEEASRKDRTEKLAEMCRIPALRPFIRQYVDLIGKVGGEESEVMVYNDKGESASAMSQIEAFIAYVNSNAQKIFTVVSNEDTRRKTGGNVSEEVDRRTKQYMQRTGEKNYNTAMHKVLDEDPQLKQDYAAAAG